MLFPSNTTETPKEITEADVIGFIEAHGRRIRAEFPNSFCALSLEHVLYSNGETSTRWVSYRSDAPITNSPGCATLDEAMAHVMQPKMCP